ncbi:potassium channel family protein [Serinicoccus chungangensis]|uniref:potassium channel family protein n=1 Tax=Serinicoccus chungangensis TaxID=767452 RepID=UPI00130510C1|nr:potassium channel family protein [Serinicoccus chungangensis]
MVIRRLLHHRQVVRATLLGAISAYLLIALAFFYAFLAAEHYHQPPLFGDPQPTTSFMYFSLTSITTLGYGDLAARTEIGRLLATTEAVLGQVYLVTVVAMVVSLLAQTWSDRPHDEA